MKQTIYELQAEVCRALAHPARLEILHRLRSGETAASDLGKTMGLTNPNLSQHMRILVAQGLAVSRREGARVLYRLGSEDVPAACDLMRSVIVNRLKAQDAAISDSIARE